MTINNSLKQVQELSRLGISDAEIEKFGGELSSVISYIEIISSVEIPNQDSLFAHKNQVRNDESMQASDFEIAKIVEQFPQAQNNYNKVPSIMKKK